MSTLSGAAGRAAALGAGGSLGALPPALPSAVFLPLAVRNYCLVFSRKGYTRAPPSWPWLTRPALLHPAPALHFLQLQGGWQLPRAKDFTCPAPTPQPLCPATRLQAARTSQSGQSADLRPGQWEQRPGAAARALGYKRSLLLAGCRCVLATSLARCCAPFGKRKFCLLQISCCPSALFLH